jgi:hypothetical protein
MANAGKELFVTWPYAYFELAQVLTLLAFWYKSGTIVQTLTLCEALCEAQRDVLADGSRYEGFFSTQATIL